MKKILIALLALSVMTAIASAAIGIEWKSYWGGYVNTAADPLTYLESNSIRESYNVIWQLIFAGADNAIDDATPATGGPNGNYVTDDDLVLATRTLPSGTGTATAPEDSTNWDAWLANAGGVMLYQNLGWTTPGYIYQRVFQGTPAVFSWYYTGSLLALNTAWEPSVPGSQQVFYTEQGYPGWTQGTGSGYKPLQQFPIPEPATMGLLGLGALVLAVRRRRS